VTKERLEKLTKVAALRQKNLAVILEDLHDPHNAAAILRTCDAFGVQDVRFIFDQEKAYNPRRIGKVSSASANKWLSITVYKSTAEALTALRKEKFQNAATLLDAKSVSLSRVKFPEKIALWLGNEHRGLSPLAAEAAHLKINIPMSGLVQSLNVSVTAAILIYEISRQREKKPQLLSAREQKNLLNKWQKK
jgi:tRNA (guanosine-2'-O-)-methyltransferase